MRVAVVGWRIVWTITPRGERGEEQTKNVQSHSGVLIVDDDQATRDTIRLLFEYEGYLVLEASNGRSALNLLNISRSRLIVLLDWFLPDLDGIQVIQQHALAATEPSSGQRSRRHTFILLTASSKSVADLPPGMSVSIVRKPFDMSDLLALVGAAAAEVEPRG